MSGTVHLTVNNVSGCGSLPKKYLQPSVSRWSLASHQLNINIGYIKCSSSGAPLVCKAGTGGGHRKNPDFSRQNKNSFRGRSRQNEERDNVEGLEDQEMLSSKNGPLLSLSNSPKFQATSVPGAREKEIVELFRKVQAQLRSRAAAKDEKKAESSRRQGRESETVDSLLKLLRKHSSDHGRKKGSSFGSRGIGSGQSDGNAAYMDDQSVNSPNFKTKLHEDHEEHDNLSSARPTSSFRRKSPIPKSGSQPVYANQDTNNFTTSFSSTWTRKKGRVKSGNETEIGSKSGSVVVGNHDSVTELVPQTESVYEVEGDDDDKEVASVAEAEDEAFDVDDADIEEDAGQDVDLSALKLTELRALAKSRGLKGFSKMKKVELVELLGGSSL